MRSRDSQARSYVRTTRRPGTYRSTRVVGARETASVGVPIVVPPPWPVRGGHDGTGGRAGRRSVYAPADAHPAPRGAAIHAARPPPVAADGRVDPLAARRRDRGRWGRPHHLGGGSGRDHTTGSDRRPRPATAHRHARARRLPCPPAPDPGRRTWRGHAPARLAGASRVRPRASVRRRRGGAPRARGLPGDGRGRHDDVRRLQRRVGRQHRRLLPGG